MKVLTLGDLAQVSLSSADEDLVVDVLIRTLLVRKRGDRADVVRPRALANERHRTSTLEVSDGSDRRVDGELVVVCAETVTVSVRVREEAGLEDGVRGGLDTGNEVRRREGGLLDLREVVLDVLVQDQLADGAERELGVRPNFSEIENVVAELLGLLNRHGLLITTKDQFDDETLMMMMIRTTEISQVGKWPLSIDSKSDWMP